MRGDIAIPLTRLDQVSLDLLRQQSTRQVTHYNGDVEQVVGLRLDTTHAYLPRYFQPDIYWPQVGEWAWTEGRQFDFTLRARLDPDRGQPTSFERMTEHLRARSGGVLVAPTGTGKTIMGYSIASAFNRFIGVPVYVGHMMDNWVEHAAKVLGLSEDQIGVVQGDRCDLGRPVTVMMIQSLLARRYPDELYEQIGFMVCDEVHRYGAEVWRTVVAQFPARYRLGLSANPSRKDGLTDFVTWTFGDIGHRAPRIRTAQAQPPTCYVLQTDREYKYESYCKWERTEDGYRPGEPLPQKYDKQLAKDQARNLAFAREIVNGLKAGRQIIVLSTLVDHLATVRELTWKLLEEIHPVERIVKNVPYGSGKGFYRLDTLAANLKKPELRARVFDADVIFATYTMGRDALNLPKLDTAVFLTPPGDPLQPVGRLREKVEGIERKPLLVLMGAERTKFSQDKLRKHKTAFQGLGIKVVELQRRSASCPG